MWGVKDYMAKDRAIICMCPKKNSTKQAQLILMEEMCGFVSCGVSLFVFWLLFYRWKWGSEKLEDEERSSGRWTWMSGGKGR